MTHKHHNQEARSEAEIPHPLVVRIPRFRPKRRLLGVRWSIPVPHMNILRVRRGVATPIMKIAGAMFMMATMYVGIASTGGTISYFSDTEVSSANTLKADPLGFTLSLRESQQVDMSSGSAFVIPVITPNADSEPIQFSMTAHMIGGDRALCSMLHVHATTTLVFDGSIVDLSAGMSTSTGEQPMLVTLDPNADLPLNTSCFIDLDFKARNADSPLGKGYVDEKQLTVQFFIPASAIMQPPPQVSTSAVVEYLPSELTATETATTSSVEEGIEQMDAGTSSSSTDSVGPVDATEPSAPTPDPAQTDLENGTPTSSDPLS